MATSFNNIIDGSKLYPGYEFAVTVDTYSENVLLVTGFIGSKKYRGALLSLPTNIIRSCASDNVFNSDFSTKNSYPVTNMAITNYYSQPKLHCSDIMFSVNKRAKENYICVNCKMKMSFHLSKKDKEQISASSSMPKPNTNCNINNAKSDITVLKQTLSYPDDLMTATSTHGDKSIPAPITASKSLKRRKDHTNHIIVDKKCKMDEKLPQKEITSEKDPPSKIESSKQSKTISNQPVEEKPIEKSTVVVEENAAVDSVDECDDSAAVPTNYDEYRSMPLSLSTLNYAADGDLLNRECPKPKKIWMKMIENEDSQKLTDPPPPLAELPAKVDKEHQSPIATSVVVNNKTGKTRYASNRSYKIKQTLHDKVILTVEKRSDKPKCEPAHIVDIYAFPDDSEIVAPNHDCCVAPKPHNEDPARTDGSIKSSNSSSSKTSRKKAKKSPKSSHLLAVHSENENKTEPVVPANVPSAIKMEPDSTTDVVNSFVQHDDLSMVIESCNNNAGVSFQLNDVVWAKITGYPFWPAKIISFSRDDDTFVGCIEWYAWNEVSFIKVNNLFHFHAHYPSKYQKRNRNGKYQEAVKLARFDCGMQCDLAGSKATSEDNENVSSIKGSDTDSESNAASNTSASL